MLTLKMNVVKPIPMVETSARGTTFSGLLVTSAKCNVASKPAYMYLGVINSVRKDTTGGHPVSLSKLVHT